MAVVCNRGAWAVLLTDEQKDHTGEEENVITSLEKENWASGSPSRRAPGGAAMVTATKLMTDKDGDVASYIVDKL